MTTTMMTFGQLIHACRLADHLTLIGVCKKVGGRFNKGYLSGMEHEAVNPPSTAVTKKLAKALGINDAFLLALGYASKAPKEIREKLIRLAWKSGEFEPHVVPQPPHPKDEAQLRGVS